jgi:uncharacterized protein (DUF305 family)
MSGKRTVTLASIAVVGAIWLTGCGNGAATSPATPSLGASASRATGEHNAADVEFAQGMVPHHAQAIEMADMVLAKAGVDERVLRLAQRIKSAQGPEIEQMTEWLDEWGAEVPETGDAAGMDHSTMGHGSGGMMSEEDMAALADAEGAQAGRLFLQQMIAHHQGAVTMAETEVAHGADVEAIRLAQAIIDAQRAEIAEMNELLQEL